MAPLVLVVDDEPPLVHLVRSYLEREGFRVASAADGESALLVQPVRDLAHRLRWSAWRRRHQARARTSHYQRQAALQP